MGMGNAAYHRLCDEFKENYAWNDAFHAYVNENFKPYRTIYGGEEFHTADMKAAREFWKKNHLVWYSSVSSPSPIAESDLSMDAHPFGGWKSEKDEAVFLKTLRKLIKEADKNNVCMKPVIREFMRQYDANWDF